MMRRGTDQLLLPVNPLFIGFSILLAFVLNIVPLGRSSVLPDFLALVLVFWNVHQPRRVGVGVAFGLGVLMDVHDTALLGQHALAYTLLSYLAIVFHRRLLGFSPLSQALQIFPLFIASHAVSIAVRMLMGGMLPSWKLLLVPLLEGLLWPVVSWLLLAPQRRAPDRDENRPL